MMTPAALRRLSTLLDHAFELDEAERARWLASLSGDDAALGATLRDLLARRASGETADLVDRVPSFTVTDGAADASELHAGDIVGPYRLERSIGQGGMGEVWLAGRTDGHLKRQVALKLPVLSVRRATLVQRFARERDILGSLAHPNVARLYDAGLADDGQPFLALEYVDGKPITLYCDEQRMDARARVVLMRQVLDAVQYAHAHLVIHRDLKPANVLVTSQGQAMLLDFGVAKLLDDEDGKAHETELTRMGGRALTLDYAAPEQLSGAAISTATDVYALGVLLYELLARQRPYRTTTRAELERAVVQSEPARPSQQKDSPIARLPRGQASDLDTIVLKALKKEPSQRYPSVTGLAADLDRWLAGEPVQARPDSAAYRMRKFVGRHRVGVATGGLVAVMLVGAVAVSLWQASIAQREARTAEAVETFLSDVFKANSSEQPDPEAARRTSARELLDIGARRIDAALIEAPEARQRVLKTLAKMYEDLTLYEQSLTLERQRLRVMRDLVAADSPRLAGALLDMNLAAIQAGDSASADAAMAEATALYERRRDDSSFERGRLESQHAYMAMTLGRPGALEHARRAVAILRQYPPSSELIHALARQAFAAELEKQLEASMASLKEALSLAEPGNIPGSESLVVELYMQLGRTQASDLELPAAAASFRRAYEYARRREGPDSIQTLNAAVELGQHLCTFSRCLEAVEVLRPAAAAAHRRIAKGDRTWVPVLAVAWHGAAQARSGLLEAGMDELSSVLGDQAVLTALPPPVHAYLLVLAAESSITLGDIAAATAHLDRAEAINASQGVRDPDINVLNARLSIAMAKHEDPSIARLVETLGIGQPKAGERPERAARRQSWLAEATYARGDTAAALTAATGALDGVAASDSRAELREPECRALLVAGRAYIAGRQPAQAEAALRRAVAVAEQTYDVATSPQLADARVALASALLDLGQRDEALRLVDLAQGAHDRHAHLDAGLRDALATVRKRLDPRRA